MSPFSPAGFIVSWHVPTIVSLADLRAGITAAGLDALDYAPDLKAQSIVSRSAGAIAKRFNGKDQRNLSRKVEATKRQITTEYVDPNGLTYSKLARVEYDDSTGKLTSDVLTGLDAVQTEIVATRKAGDVTRVLQRVTEDASSDLIPVRENGGAYFIPAGHAVIDKLQTIIEAVGGSMNRFACTIGHGYDADATGQSVANVITDYMLKQIAELREAVAELGEKGIRSDARRNRLSRVATLKDRLSAYASLIGASGERLTKELASAEEMLLAKLAPPKDDEPVDEKDAAFAASVE